MNMRHTIRLLAAVTIMLMASCTKESDELVTLNVNLEQYNSTNKSYIDNEGYSCWLNGDDVRINSEVKSITISNGRCKINNATYSENGYTALYPASLTTNATIMGSSEITGIQLPTEQIYETVEGQQQVPTVMAAHLATATGTINFYNACIALKITLVNNYSRTLQLESVTVSDNIAPLCGSFSITGVNSTTPSLSHVGTITDADKKVTLQMSTGGITLTTGNEVTLYVILPPTADYENNKFTIEVKALDYEDITNSVAVTVYEFSHTQSDQASGALARNTMAPIHINLNDALHTTVLKGVGTENNPYRIYDMADLRSMQKLVNAGQNPIMGATPFASAYYQLMADINAYGADAFLPIGTTNNNFTGHFDGLNHTIANISVWCGLFGYISQGASITNLTVSNATVDMTDTPVGGIVCAHADRSVIDHCRVSGTATFTNVGTSAAYMGGIVGEATALTVGSSTVTNCHCAARITLQGSAAHRLGGIAGHLLNSSVCNCYTQVNDNTENQVTISIGNAYAGGIVGRCDGGAGIVNCYYGIHDNATGAEAHFADLCSEISSATRITYCYYSHRINILGTANEEYIQQVCTYDQTGGTRQYAVNGTHIGTLLNNTAQTLGMAEWSVPISSDEVPEAPQLDF